MLRKSLPPLPAKRRPKVAASVVPAIRSSVARGVTDSGRLGLRGDLCVVGRPPVQRQTTGRRIGAPSC